MRAREFIVDHSGQKLDEFLPALAAAGGALAKGAVAGAGALGRGAMAAGNAALTGAQAAGRGIAQGVQKVGSAAVQGAQKVGSAAVQGAQKVGSAAVQDVEKIAQATPQAITKTTNSIKSGLDKVKTAVQQAGGGGTVNTDRLSKAMVNQVPGQPMDPQAQQDLEALMPGIQLAMKQPNTAGQITQAISTAAQQNQQKTATPPPGSVGSTPNTISPA